MRPWHRTTDHTTKSVINQWRNTCFNEAVAQNHGSLIDAAQHHTTLCDASMRPWHRTTDHEAQGRQTRSSRRLASMRPWHRTTDHLALLAALLAGHLGFNEAVAQNHGSHCACIDQFAQFRGFNEAVAQNHGSLCATLHKLCSPTSFNEAVAQNHGSHSVEARGQEPGASASMRPWHRTTDHREVEKLAQCARGASMRPWHRTTDHLAQDSGHRTLERRFNEAVAQNHGSRGAVGEGGPRPDGASMRPWHRTTDHINGGIHESHHDQASMRPWHRTTDHDELFEGMFRERTQASMRPWHRTTDHSAESIHCAH